MSVQRVLFLLTPLFSTSKCALKIYFCHMVTIFKPGTRRTCTSSVIAKEEQGNAVLAVHFTIMVSCTLLTRQREHFTLVCHANSEAYIAL